MRIWIVTDIPVWVRPLQAALESRGADVGVATSPEEVSGPGLIVNRLSTLLMRTSPERASTFEEALRDWEQAGQRVVNRARCYRLGYRKLAQATLFREAGVQTPPTLPAIPGGRAFPGQAALLKPAAGGFGKGIRVLAPDEPAPMGLFAKADGWIEQVRLRPVDGAVHRVEIVGTRILYDATSPLEEDEFNYCLAHADEGVKLSTQLEPALTEAVQRIASAAEMELGSIEYLRDSSGDPVFIDLNPVSSLHPQADAILGDSPYELIAAYLISKVL